MSDTPITSTSIALLRNPACGTSRNTLALIRHSGVEPVTQAARVERSRRVAP